MGWVGGLGALAAMASTGLRRTSVDQPPGAPPAATSSVAHRLPKPDSRTASFRSAIKGALSAVVPREAAFVRVYPAIIGCRIICESVPTIAIGLRKARNLVVRRQDALDELRRWSLAT